MDETKQTRRAVIAIAVVAALGLHPVAVGAAPPVGTAPAEPQKATEEADAAASMVEVHVGEAITRAGTLGEKVHDDVVRVLRAHRIDLDAQTRTRLTIGVGGESYAYRINIAVFRDQHIVAPAPAPWTCECTNEELSLQISQHVVDLLPELRGDEAPTQAAAAPVTTPEHAGPADRPSDDRRLRTFGHAGIGMLIGGVGLAAAGGALVGVGEQEHRSGTDVEGSGTSQDLRPVGYTLLGVGAAAVVAGVILIAVDRHRARRRATAIAPVLGPRMTGFSLTTRF